MHRLRTRTPPPLFLLLAVVLGLALLSRLMDLGPGLPRNPYPTKAVLSIGVVGRESVGNGADAEVAQGLKVWLARRNPDPTLTVAQRRITVKLNLYDEDGSPADARRAVRRAVAAGHNLIVAPTNPRGLDAVAREARRQHVLLLSARPRPSGGPSWHRATFLARPAVGDFAGALDVIDRRVDAERLRRHRRGGSRGHLTILYRAGAWGFAAEQAAIGARARAYSVRLVPVAGNGSREIGALRRRRADAVLVAAQFSDGLRWFRSAAGPSGAPWVLTADDVRSVSALVGRERVAVTTPWAPTSSAGGFIFGAGDFPRLYRTAYGTEPTTDAASGAALGVLLDAAVQVARTTDPNRVLDARDALKTPTFWGQLSFRGGEQQPPFPAAVTLLGRTTVRPISPDPQGAGLLGTSLPARAGTAVT